MKKVSAYVFIVSLGFIFFTQLAYSQPPILRTLQEQVDPKVAALLVIDMQNDFVADEGKLGKIGLNVKLIQETVPKINRLVEEARTAGVPIFWLRSTHTLKDALPNYLAYHIVIRSGKQVKDEDLICRPNHWSSEYYDKLIKPAPGEMEVIKHWYSGFQDTRLDLLLRAADRKTIICTGTTSDVCVANTANHGLHLGYYPIFVSDCTATTDQTVHDTILKIHKTYYGYVLPSSELINFWKK
jgi:nicotinamidase-related amidase